MKENQAKKERKAWPFAGRKNASGSVQPSDDVNASVPVPAAGSAAEAPVEVIPAVDRTVAYHTDPNNGLTASEVRQRKAHGEDNVDDAGQTRTVKEIVLKNVLTLFNLINIILAVSLIAVGSFKNLTFMAIILSNVAIGIFQEIRSKKAMDRLSFLSASKVKVVRDGKEEELNSQDVVLDDLMILTPGNQVQADAVILEGVCQVDESFITGEADAIAKEPGDTLMAGSFLINGRCRAQASAVGKQKYVSTISAGSKFVKKVRSEIMTSLQWIVRIISVLIVPLGVTIFLNQFNLEGATIQSAVVSTTASLIGMIPEGLMLLTSTALAVSVIRLAQSKVMVQQLYCIETLARVDTLCLDKTGTLTEGSMEVVDLVQLSPDYNQWLPNALTALVTSTPDQNATSTAILEKYPADGMGSFMNARSSWQCIRYVSFSSKTKWSGASFVEEGTFCMGAAEFLYPNMPEDLRRQINEYASQYRVILLMHSNEDFRGENLPPESSMTPLALVLLRDKVREAAAPTLQYFADQGVTVKVISGDSPQTVAGIARYAGVKNWDRLVDASTLKTDEEVAAAANEYTVFGRVTPQQKKQLIHAMKQAGHTVAMTGDGVNDVMALKESDCSIAMASGTDAARNASELVLLDSNFDSLPKVVAEGRRCINNVQRSSSLFLTKTVYSGLLALLFVFVNMQYPFIPIQMSLISSTCIGIPAFLLALQPNRDRVRGKFLTNVVSKAIPGGLSVAINIGFIMYCASVFGLDSSLVSTLCVIVAGFTGLLTLYRISKPFNWLRILIFYAMLGAFVSGIIFLRDFLQLHAFDSDLMIFMFIFMAAAYGLITFMYRISEETIPGIFRSLRDFRQKRADRKAERSAKKAAKAAEKAARAVAKAQKASGDAEQMKREEERKRKEEEDYLREQKENQLAEEARKEQRKREAAENQKMREQNRREQMSKLRDMLAGPQPEASKPENVSAEVSVSAQAQETDTSLEQPSDPPISPDPSPEAAAEAEPGIDPNGVVEPLISVELESGTGDHDDYSEEDE